MYEYMYIISCLSTYRCVGIQCAQISCVCIVELAGHRISSVQIGIGWVSEMNAF